MGSEVAPTNVGLKTIAEDKIAVELSPSLYLAHTTLAASYQHLGLGSLARNEMRLAEAANPNAAGQAAVVSGKSAAGGLPQ